MRERTRTIGCGTWAGGLLLGAIWLVLAVFGIGTIAGAQAGNLPLIAASGSRDGEVMLRKARSAERSGDFGIADRLYRSAWSDVRTRDAAAKELRRLHKRTGFRLSVDSGQVTELEQILGRSFVRTETDHFVILSDADRAWTQQRGRLLERTQRQFMRVLDRLEYPAVPSEKKLLCVFFREHRAYRAFASSEDGVEASWIAGYYTGLANRAVFYDDMTGPSFLDAFNRLNGHEKTITQTREQVRSLRKSRDTRAASTLAARADDLERELGRERKRLMDEVQKSSESKAIHEALHLLAFNCGVQSRAREYPFWLTEGMATNFETDNPNAAFGPDRPTTYREDEYVRAVSNGLLPLEEFVGLSTVPADDPDLADVLYAQGYSLFAYLYRYERRSLGDYLEAIWAQEAGVTTERERVELFGEHFGRIASLEHRWKTRTRRMLAMADD